MSEKRVQEKGMETETARAERVASLRSAYLDGSLDLTVLEDSIGLCRLLGDLFPDQPRRRRSSLRR